MNGRNAANIHPKIRQKGMTLMDEETKQKLELQHVSIAKIKIICEEAIEHDRTWWDFVIRLTEMVKQETRLIKGMKW